MSFARGFARGFLKQGLEEKAARDQAHAEMVKELGSEFKEASKLFRAEEENTQKRFKLIDEKFYNEHTDSDIRFNNLKLENLHFNSIKKEILDRDVLFDE